MLFVPNVRKIRAHCSLSADMHSGLRSLLTAMAVLLSFAPAAAADEATRELYLARDACGGTDPANIRLSATTGSFSSGCGSLAAVLGPSTTTYVTPAKDEGVPVELEPSRPATIAISVSSDPGVVFGGIGPETVEVTLSGKRAGRSVALGTASVTTPPEVMLQRTANVYEFSLPLKPEMAGRYTAITLALRAGGSQQSGYVDHGGGSFVSLPITDASVPPPAE